MAEISYFWDGSTVGDAGPYDAADMATYFRALTGSGGDEGVLAGWLNELEVTDGGGLNADVDTGAAMVYGTWFENDAAETVALAPNAAQTVIVRASWAAQTVRLAATSVALVQTPGVTYEIPLATLTTDGAGITVGPADARDYCEFSTEAPALSVFAENIQDGAITWAKQVNQTRRFFRGAGQFQPDGTNAASWVNPSLVSLPNPSYYGPYGFRDMWQFADGVTDAVWCTFRAPEDLTGVGAAPYPITLYIWMTRIWNPVTGAAGVQRWVYNLWGGASGAALANQTATTLYTENTGIPTIWRYAYRVSLGTFNATAGDIIHLQLSRTGGHGDDTSDSAAYLFMAEFEYTAAG